jgi:hypothetical protein
MYVNGPNCQPDVDVPILQQASPTFEFSIDDVLKINQEHPKITQHFNKEDKPQSEYSESTTKTIDSTKSTTSYISSLEKKHR